MLLLPLPHAPAHRALSSSFPPPLPTHCCSPFRTRLTHSSFPDPGSLPPKAPEHSAVCVGASAPAGRRRSSVPLPCLWPSSPSQRTGGSSKTYTYGNVLKDNVCSNFEEKAEKLLEPPAENHTQQIGFHSFFLTNIY